MKKGFIVETNIMIVANGKNTEADMKCREDSVKLLKGAREGAVHIDSGQAILGEYKKYCSHSGQPGLGDFFFMHVHQTQADPNYCRRVEITPKKEDPQDFEEFPDLPELARFDRSDRKWVAVALASGENPTIYNAVDSDWCQVPDAVWKKAGVSVVTLCPQCIKSSSR